MRLRIFLFAFVILCTAITSQGQSYNTAFGFRLGEELGFSLVQRVANHTSLDLSASDGLFAGHKYVSLQARSHYGIISRRFNFFLGGGGFVRSNEVAKDDYPAPDKVGGISGVMGAELTLGRISVSIDYIPQYVMSKTYTGQKLTADSAFSLKYVLWKRKSQVKKFFEKIF